MYVQPSGNIEPFFCNFHLIFLKPQKYAFKKYCNQQIEKINLFIEISASNNADFGLSENLTQVKSTEFKSESLKGRKSGSEVRHT